MAVLGADLGGFTDVSNFSRAVTPNLVDTGDKRTGGIGAPPAIFTLPNVET
ncbi:MAG TPA: hypothetical protein VLF69_05300 [Candidatus Saccharimonadales bacterium]|nr:hypothetical protein [Candidatus Saccharimonadales bacterium]